MLLHTYLLVYVFTCLMLEFRAMDNPQAYLGRLKPIHIFKGLKDDQILEIAQELEVETRPAGETIFEEGAEGQEFFIINKGKVKVLRKTRGEPRLIAMLVPGDYFGEAALLYGRRRSATVAAETNVELLRLSKEDFDNLLKKYPQIKPNLLVSTEGRTIYRTLNFGWLSPDEVVYLIARRHQVLLYQSLALPVGLSVLLLILVGAAAWFLTWELAMLALIGGALPLAGWAIWNYVDWSNDYYIVTNRRVVYLEKIVGIYDSRQEAPLGSVISVNVQTSGSLARAFGIGDVIVRTFSGPITLKSVANPQGLAGLIEEHWNRTRTREKEAEYEASRPRCAAASSSRSRPNRPRRNPSRMERPSLKKAKPPGPPPNHRPENAPPWATRWPTTFPSGCASSAARA